MARKQEIARTAIIVSTLLKSGIVLLQALEIAECATVNSEPSDVLAGSSNLTTAASQPLNIVDAKHKTGPEIGALRDTVSAIGDLGERLEQDGKFGSDFPLLDQSIGELVDIGGIFNEIFVLPFQAYLDLGNPMVEGLEDVVNSAFDNLSNASGMVTVTNTTELRYQIDAHVMCAVPVNFELEKHITKSDLNITGTLPATVNLTFDFNLTFEVQ